MKAQVPNPNQVKTHGIQKTVSFGIKQEGLAHIFNVLRNQLYSDKILAVIREYSCNAIDAHVEAGKPNLPIEITLPTMMSPTFKVRDFGPALSDAEIEDVYAFYGESTKRNSNAQIGQLGLGSKSAFAYGDNFVINSYLNGTKHSHNAFIDVSQIGQIAKLGEEATDEENGVEIIIGVKEKDCSEFEEKAANLFRHFKIKPIVKGSTNESKFDFKDSDVLFKGKNWEYLDSSTIAGQHSYGYNRPSGSPVAIMGNIGYPIDTYSLGKLGEAGECEILNENLVLHFEIGDLEISASREKLQYTEYTQESIKARVKEVSDEILETVEKRFENCKTMFAAKCFFGSVFDYSSGLYNLRNLLAKKIKWNGHVVDSDTYSTYSSSGVNLLQYKKSNRKRVRGEETNRVDCAENIVIVENDMGNRRQALNRIVPLVEGQNKRVYLFEWENAAAKKKFIESDNFDAPLTKLSSLPKEPLTKYYGSNASTGIGFHNKKHSAKCFEYDFGFDGRRWHSKKSDYWKIVDLDVENESGVYVVIDKFHPESNKGQGHGYSSTDDPSRISTFKQQLTDAGIKFPKRVYAFKVKERAKIEGKKGWTNLYDWAQKELKNVIKNANLDQAWIDTQKVDGLDRESYGNGSYRNREYSDMLKCFANKIVKEVSVADGTFASFVQKYTEMKQSEKVRAKIKTIREIAKDFDVDFKSPKGVKPTHDIKPLLKEVLEKYSMLSLVEWGSHSWDKQHDEKVINYINVIDVCEHSK